MKRLLLLPLNILFVYIAMIILLVKFLINQYKRIENDVRTVIPHTKKRIVRWYKRKKRGTKR